MLETIGDLPQRHRQPVEVVAQIPLTGPAARRLDEKKPRDPRPQPFDERGWIEHVMERVEHRDEIHG